MLQTGIFWFFIEREDLTATGPCLTLPIGNYVTLTMGSQLDTSSQISELKGTRGLRDRTHALHSWPRCFVLSVKNKAYTEQTCFQIKYLLAHIRVLLVRKHVFFCFKIRFPWKEQWQNQRRQVFGGAERTKSFAQKVLRFGERQAVGDACFLGWCHRMGFAFVENSKAATWVPRGDPGARHTGRSVGDSVSQLWSASVLRAWLWHCLRVPRGLGIAGLILDVRVLRLLPTHSQGLCHAAALWRASTSMQPRCTGHSWGGQPRRLAQGSCQ